MKLSIAQLVAAVFTVAHAQDDMVTWFSTRTERDYIHVSSLFTVEYGNSSIMPVPTLRLTQTATLYLNEPVVSQNLNHTIWSTVFETAPLKSRWDVRYTKGLIPNPTVTVEGTETANVWTSATVATVTLSPTTCTNGVARPNSTATVYTGEYQPFPGQVTTTKTAWPTAVTTYFFLTESQHLFTFTGTAMTYISTVTATSYLSTTTVGTTTLDYGTEPHTYTRYSHTVTQTRRNNQLAFTTKLFEASCNPGTPTTVTRAAQCAPTNMISERDGLGIRVSVSMDNWAFPRGLGYPDVLIGIPNLDAGACCQLCLDNKGCAASEWIGPWHAGCSLLFFSSPGLNNTCGTVPLGYFGDVWYLPQTSFIQVGCGSLTYLGVRN